MDKIIIWGLGSYSRKIMRRRMIPVDIIEGIVDIDKNLQGKIIFGKEIMPPERLKEYSSRVIVVGASPRFYNEIVSQIDDKYKVLSIENFAQKFSCFENFSTAMQLWEEEIAPLVRTVEEYNAVWDEFKDVMTVRKISDNYLGNKVRVGRNNDGGYVMIEDACKRAKIAYSIGLSDDVSWDLQMAEQYGCDVFQYDHTIKDKPLEHKKFHYKRIGICGSSCNSQECMTLEQMVENNHHQNEIDMILKMDVEGEEWEVIETLTDETIK